MTSSDKHSHRDQIFGQRHRYVIQELKPENVKKPRFLGANRVTICWGTWTRTKNKRIRIFRVANYTIPHRTRGEPGRLVTLTYGRGVAQMLGRALGGA
jgi:hypothetical protein